MHPIYSLYWSSFQTVFVFLSLTLTLLFAGSFFIGKERNSAIKNTVLLWIPSLTTFTAVLFISFFSGILYDELNIPTDDFILFLMGYSTIVFLLHTAKLIYNMFRLKKQKSPLKNY